MENERSQLDVSDSLRALDLLFVPTSMVRLAVQSADAIRKAPLSNRIAFYCAAAGVEIARAAVYYNVYDLARTLSN